MEVYDPDSGLTGTISRTRGTEIKTGTVAALPDEMGGDLEIRVFTGGYGATRTIEIWTDEEFPEEKPQTPPSNTLVETDYDLAGDDGMGAFCFTCSEELLLGMYRNYPDFDEWEESGVLFGQFTDPPINTEFELIVKGEIFAAGEIDGATTSGTWYEQY